MAGLDWRGARRADARTWILLGGSPVTLAQGTAPSVVSLNPFSGPTAGGTGVTISDTHFSGTVTVTFGGARDQLQ